MKSVVLLTLLSAVAATFGPQKASGAAAGPPVLPSEEPVQVVARHLLKGAGAVSGSPHVDEESRAVYVPRATRVDVLDADSGARIGHIGPTQQAVAIALSRPLQRGFIIDRGNDTVTVFDLMSRAVVAVVRSGGREPVDVEFDVATQRLFIAHADSREVCVLDAKSLRLLGRVPMDGTPRQLVSNQYGRVFVTLGDRNRVQLIDSRGVRRLGSFPLFGGKGPDGVGIDPTNRRLFVANDNGRLIVLDSDIGFLLADLAIATGASSVVVDVTPVPGDELEKPAVIHAYSGSAQGPLTVVRMLRFDTFAVTQSLDVQRSSRWLVLDGRHRIIVAAESAADIVVAGR